MKAEVSKNTVALLKAKQTIKQLRKKLANTKQAKRFPNGFTSWMETHHEIVSAIHEAIWYHENESRDLSNRITEVLKTRGTGGLYELAEDLTDRFEQAHINKAWDGEFFDAIAEFLETELK